MPDPPQTLAVDERPITLVQALKLAGVIENGGQAKALIAEGLVRVNGQVELRKRRQLAVGDRIAFPDGTILELVPAPPPSPLD